MTALFTTLTLVMGLIALLFGTVKGIRDLRQGNLVFTEFRMLIGGALMAGSTITASLLTPAVLGRPEVQDVLALAGTLPAPADQVCWWVLALVVAGISVVITPGPRAMMEEYAIERGGVAGLMLTQQNSGNRMAGR